MSKVEYAAENTAYYNLAFYFCISYDNIVLSKVIAGIWERRESLVG